MKTSWFLRRYTLLYKLAEMTCPKARTQIHSALKLHHWHASSYHFWISITSIKAKSASTL